MRRDSDLEATLDAKYAVMGPLLNVGRLIVFLMCALGAGSCVRRSGDTVEVRAENSAYAAKIIGSISGYKVPFVSRSVSTTIVRKDGTTVGPVPVFSGDWMDPSFNEAFVSHEWIRGRAFRFAIPSRASQTKLATVEIWNRSSATIPCVIVAASDLILLPDLASGGKEKFDVTNPPSSSRMWVEATAYTSNGGTLINTQQATFRRAKPSEPMSFKITVLDGAFKLEATQ